MAVRCNVASPSASTEDAEEVKGRILAAGRDCVPRQRNSIVALQSRTGVEVVFFFLLSLACLSAGFILVLQVFDVITL